MIFLCFFLFLSISKLSELYHQWLLISLSRLGIGLAMKAYRYTWPTAFGRDHLNRGLPPHQKKLTYVLSQTKEGEKTYLRRKKNHIWIYQEQKTYFSGEEYVKSLTANPELIDRLACLSEEGVCLSLFYFVFEKWNY